MPTSERPKKGAALVVEHDGNEDQAIGALLHDAAEDQGGQKYSMT
jgi:hypothetical protein